MQTNIHSEQTGAQRLNLVKLKPVLAGAGFLTFKRSSFHPNIPMQTSPGRLVSTGRSLSRRSAEFQVRLRDHTQTSLWAGRKVRQTLAGGGGVGWGVVVGG